MKRRAKEGQMQSLSVQVQPNRSRGLNMERLKEAFQSIAAVRDLVSDHSFNHGNDDGPYFNFTFSTPQPRQLWIVIQENIYRSPEFGAHMARASITVCSSKSEWDDYLKLFHFDPLIECDSPIALDGNTET